ncbi:branched-chain amino acid ABC transporter ATP-binding protein/permease [Reyranella sp.]|jgi:ABC-type branched-subunit amino acid transport system ATPase component/ABC-type branched-subunit amino acid transport system permease subunit|uniref:branched-chain amino acid ABC transporter ATP-binding protein/permease n=1 Tax=Reyranella sp. TaxID=1929291 RepID=UPI00120CF4AA|nr:branched-chain amino acid ABC transporter ATP-binding protein/permease [Reyranella sp.]TAJ81345.1 MAG: branched-chain amino acid ABC transporter ATP-binding protein/permease [Reyranella sp.]
MRIRYLFAAALVAILPMVAPNQFYLLLASDIAYLAIAAIGLNILIGLSGQLSIGQAGFYAVGGYTSAILAMKYGIPLALSAACGLVAGLLVGGIMSLVALRTRTHYLAMATLAFGFIVEILVQRWVDLTGGSMGLIGVPRLNYGSVADGPTYFFWTVGAALVLCQMFSDYIIQSEWGRRLLAVKESEKFAATIGIHAPLWRAATFTFAAVLASLSGIFFVHQSGYISSDAFGLDRSIQFLIVVVVGGLGRPYAAVLGAAFIVVLNQATASLYEVSYLIFGVIFLGVMLFFPTGISGLLEATGRRFVRQPREEQGSAATIEPFNRRGIDAEFALGLEGVVKSYAGVKAVDDASLLVRTGTIHALIGPNGAGKSTLINVISGLYLAERGTIRLFGQDVSRSPAHMRARMGMARTFQNLQLISGIPVLENVMLGLHRHKGMMAGFLDWLMSGRLEAQQRAIALGILAFFGVEKFAKARVGDLSYGHRKLVEMARAVAQQPVLMLLDEPIAGLNEEEAKEVAKAIRQLRQRGMTVVLVEHNMPFVMGISDRVTVLNYGRIIGEGTPAEIQNDAAVISAYLGAAAIDGEPVAAEARA